MTLLDSQRVSADVWTVSPCAHLAPFQLDTRTNA